MIEARRRITVGGAITSALLALGTFCLLALIAITFGDVLARNLFNTPVPGALEMSEYWAMVPLVFIGVWWSGVLRDHVRVTIVTERLGPSTDKLAEVIVTVISTAFLLYLAHLGFLEATRRMQLGEYAGAYRTAVWPVRYIVAIGFLAYGIVLVVQLVDLLRTRAGPR